LRNYDDNNAYFAYLETRGTHGQEVNLLLKKRLLKSEGSDALAGNKLLIATSGVILFAPVFFSRFRAISLPPFFGCPLLASFESPSSISS
jgi:hypothetical protein